jgi:hypothetical protein
MFFAKPDVSTRLQMFKITAGFLAAGFASSILKTARKSSSLLNLILNHLQEPVKIIQGLAYIRMWRGRFHSSSREGAASSSEMSHLKRMVPSWGDGHIDEAARGGRRN